MLSAALAFIPLLSGYIFVNTWFRTSYQIKRDNSQKVYFRAAFWGMWLFLLSFSLVTHFEALLNPALTFFSTWKEQGILTEGLPASINLMFWIFCLAGTLLLGLVGGFLLNWVTGIIVTALYIRRSFAGGSIPLLQLLWLLPVWHKIALALYPNAKKYEIRKAILDFNSEVEIMLLRALEYGMPVSVTTPSKVYVGYVMGAIETDSKRESLRILPVISGYRDSKTRKVTFTTSYLKVYERFSEDSNLSHLQPSLFEVVIAADEIKTISLFDVKAYSAFQEDGAGDPNQLELQLLNYNR